MTAKQFAFWTFMGIAGLWFIAAIIVTGKYAFENWGASVAIERAKR